MSGRDLRNRIKALEIAMRALNSARAPAGIGVWESVRVLTRICDEYRAALAKMGE